MRAGVAAVSAALLTAALTPLTAGGAAAATLLPAPGLVGPLDAGPVLKQVVLDWVPSAGATSYVVQVGTDDEWSDTPTLQLPTIASRLTLPTWLPHASYVWRVAAVGAGGRGDWSENGTFSRGWQVRATPVSPSEATAVHDATGVPTFRWTPVATASEYQLQVSTAPFFDAPYRTAPDAQTETCFTTRTSVTPFTGQANARNDAAGSCTFTLLGTGEPRYWRVRPLDHVVDGAEEVDTSPVVDEGITSRPPQPAPDSLDTSGCGGDSGAPAAAPPTGAVAGSCAPAHAVEKGPWSTVTPFSSTLPAAPADTTGLFRTLAPVDTPSLSADVCVGSLCRDFPTLSWPAVTGASSYRLYVALDAAYDNLQAIVETPALQWTPTDQWRESTAGASYYVVVQPCTSGGCGAVGTPTVFRKTSPRLAPLAPLNGALLGGGEVVLSWQSAADALRQAISGPPTSEAYAYDVQVTRADNPTFAGDRLVDTATVDSTHHVSADKAYGDGAFLWRVQAVDASGHRQPWSAVQSFGRDSVAPTFTVAPTAGLAVDGTVRVIFSEPVTGISASSVRLSGVESVLTAAADRRSVTVTPQRLLVPGATHRLTVGAGVQDLAGNPVAARTVDVRVAPVVDDRSPAVALTGSWTALGSSDAVAGTYSRNVPSARERSSASVTLVGRGVEVKGCVGPANGGLEVWVDGARVARVDTYRSYTACGVTLARAVFGTGPWVHRVEVRGDGLRTSRSKGTAVGIDALTAIR